MSYERRFIHNIHPDNDWPQRRYDHSTLPLDWFRLATERDADALADCSRREAEDAAAFAFARLPAERPKELLAARPGGG